MQDEEGAMGGHQIKMNPVYHHSASLTAIQDEEEGDHVENEGRVILINLFYLLDDLMRWYGFN